MSAEAREAALSGRSLTIARAAWIGLALLGLGLFITAISPGFSALSTVCAERFCSVPRLSSDEALRLQELGLSMGFYAWYQSALGVGLALWYCLIGVVIFWRKSNDWLALWVSITLITLGTALLSPFKAASGLALWEAILTIILGSLAAVSFLLLGFRFPDGRFRPAWAGRWAVPFGFLALVPVLSGPIGFATRAIQIATPTLAQIYRLRRETSAVQRQQTVWLVTGYLAAAVGMLGQQGALLILKAGSGRRLYFYLVGLPIIDVFLFLFPLLIAFSILRYRLWDIDFFINRTLVYTVLMAVLGLIALLIYFILVALLQDRFRGLANELNAVASGASILALLTLFQPLRQRVQEAIDRRFYRSKYDALQSLASFSAGLRAHFDPDAVSHALVAAVSDTMQPTSISLWLREPRNGAILRAIGIEGGAVKTLLAPEVGDRHQSGGTGNQ